MKFRRLTRSILEQEDNRVYQEDIEEELEKAFGLLNKRVLEIVNASFASVEKRGASTARKEIAASVEIKDNGLLEGIRDSVRLTILSKAWNKKFPIKKPKLIEISKSEKNNIINYLVSNKEKIKFSSGINNKSKTKIYDNINDAIDKVFNKDTLNNIFEESNENLYKTIMKELKKHIEDDFLKSKEFLVNTEKRISELDITFIDKLKRSSLSKLEPNGANKFPDYIYTFSGEPEKFLGEKQLLDFLEKSGISKTNKVYIEMKGDKTSRVASSQTTSGKFFGDLSEDLKSKLSSLSIDDTISLNQDEVKKIIAAANLNSAFEYPTLYVKPARNEIAVFYLKDRDFNNFKIKRQKKSLSLFTEGKNKSGKKTMNKMFSIELTGTANQKIFGEK